MKNKKEKERGRQVRIMQATAPKQPEEDDNEEVDQEASAEPPKKEQRKSPRRGSTADKLSSGSKGKRGADPANQKLFDGKPSKQTTIQQAPDGRLDIKEPEILLREIWELLAHKKREAKALEK